jgi:ATP-dependent RNA helicase DDX23/PRP28
MPKTLEIYMHRIGRTGRAGLEGKSTSFLTNEDTDIMYDLKQMLIQNDYTVPAELSRHEAAQVRPGTAPSRSSRVIFKM